MRADEFKYWIRNESGLTPGNAGQWVSYGKRVESYIGDLDRWYRKYPNVSDAPRAAVAKGAPNKECRVLNHYWDFCDKYPPGSGVATTAASSAGGRRSAEDNRTQESPVGNRGNRNAGGANNGIGDFWNPGGFDNNDDINTRIWEDSPGRQSGITPCPPNGVGAQQAMLEARDIGTIMAAPGNYSAAKSCKPNQGKCCCLPWVPDLVGKNWKEKDAILVFGSAYAGFIKEYTVVRGINIGIPAKDYASANDYWDFQNKLFLPQVVQGAWGGTNAYYGRIASLLKKSGYTSVEKVLVSDLCRASFVEKGSKRNGDRKDKGGDGVVRKFPDIFSNYVSHNNDWTWERITKSSGGRVIALGEIAG